MSSVSTINTLVPNATIPLGYYDEDNIRFIQNKIVEVLSRQFRQKILFDRDSIVALMERALVNGRIESIPKMNQRVIMMATNEFRNHQIEASKHLWWESHYVESQRLFDPTVASAKFDPSINMHPNRIGKPKIGGTTRFYFI
jgi:hypothetical protein